METSKLDYNYPSSRNSGVWKVERILENSDSECGKQLSISLDGVVWNYVFILTDQPVFMEVLK